ncbi:hypothetical protein FRB96_003606 [Tulasnella sp. 330]|nr:hypothetical protein FRB96_003606 [Tulasnella sp. 330]
MLLSTVLLASMPVAFAAPVLYPGTVGLSNPNVDAGLSYNDDNITYEQYAEDLQRLRGGNPSPDMGLPVQPKTPMARSDIPNGLHIHLPDNVQHSSNDPTEPSGDSGPGGRISLPGDDVNDSNSVKLFPYGRISTKPHTRIPSQLQSIGTPSIGDASRVFQKGEIDTKPHTHITSGPTSAEETPNNKIFHSGQVNTKPHTHIKDNSDSTSSGGEDSTTAASTDNKVFNSGDIDTKPHTRIMARSSSQSGNDVKVFNSNRINGLPHTHMPNNGIEEGSDSLIRRSDKVFNSDDFKRPHTHMPENE